MTLRHWFNRAATFTTDAAGHPVTVAAAFGMIGAWLVWCLFTDFGNDRQMVVNTTTTIVTFLLGFLILAATNRSSKANAVKLDELIRAQKRASDRFIGLEDADDDEIEAFRKSLRKHREGAA